MALKGKAALLTGSTRSGARTGWWESAAEHGPFVMNIREEIVAMRDHRAGKINDLVPRPVEQGGQA
jgi:hypothetical protein